MPFNVQVTFDDGEIATYDNVPDDVTPNQIAERASKKAGVGVSSIFRPDLNKTYGGAAPEQPPQVAVAEPAASKTPAEWKAQIKPPMNIEESPTEELLRETIPAVERRKELSVGQMGVATGIGAATGAVIPEILRGTGTALSFVPHPAVSAAGRGLAIAGTAMKPLGLGGRALLAGEGAFLGATSELAGQISEKYLDDAVTPHVVRLVSGAGVGIATGRMVNKALDTIHQKLTADLSEKAILDAWNKEWATEFKSIPKLHDFLIDANRVALEQSKAQANAIRIKAEEQANDLMQKATAEAEALGGANKQKAEQILSTAQRQVDSIKMKAQKEAELVATSMQAERAKRNKILVGIQGGVKQTEASKKQLINTLGNPDTPDELVGDLLRTPAVTELESLRKGLAQSSAELQKPINTALKQRALANESIDATKEYKTFMSGLAKEAGIGEKGLRQIEKTGEFAVVDKTLRNQLTEIYTALSRKNIGLEADPEATAIASYKALDDIRRKLGAAAFGKGEAEEGYKALGQQKAKEMYYALRKIQAEFVGEDAFNKLLQTQAAAKQEINEFSGKIGGRLVDLEKFVTDSYATDVRDLPTTIFKSRDSLRKALSLVDPREKQAVVEAGRIYLSKQLAGKTPQEANSWAKQNIHVIRELGLESDVAKYLGNYAKDSQLIKQSTQQITELEKGIQEVSPEVEYGITKGIVSKAEKEAEPILPKAEQAVATALPKVEKRQEQILSKAETAKEKIIKQGEQEAGKVVKPQELKLEATLQETPIVAINNLFTGKNVKKNMDLIAGMLKTPEDKELVKSALQEIPFESVSQAWFKKGLGTSLRDAGILTKDEYTALNKVMADATKTQEPGYMDKAKKALWAIIEWGAVMKFPKSGYAVSRLANVLKSEPKK